MANRKPLPYAIVEAAVHGDPAALEKVLCHYRAYICSLASRDYVDEHGVKHINTDGSVQAELEAFLLEKVMAFDLTRTQ